MKKLALSFTAMILATVGCGSQQTTSEAKYSAQNSGRPGYSICMSWDCWPQTIQGTNVQILKSRVNNHRPAVIYLGLVANAVKKGQAVNAANLDASALRLFNRQAGHVFPVINGQNEDDTAAIETLRSFHSEVGLNEDALACAQLILEGGSCD